MEWTLSDSAKPELTSPQGVASVPWPPAKEYDFEMYSLAAMQCCGWFIEPNPKEHDLLNQELFEIDAVAREPQGAPGSRLLALEAKSGDWGGGDVLRLLGRSRYFDAEGSVFVFRRATDKGPLEQRMTPRLRELGMRTVRVIDADQPTSAQVLAAFHQGLGRGPGINDHVRFTTWLYSHLVQKRLRPTWRDLWKKYPQSAAVAAARQWNTQVYENLPLAASPVERLVRQEASFRAFGRLLALRLAEEIGLVTPGAGRLTASMVDQGHNRWIQSALLLQHAARLAILANVVEIVALRPATEVQALANGSDPRLPLYWRSRLATARMHPDVVLWPRLWQTYLGCWGGFLVTDRRLEEMEALGTEVGLSLDQVDAGLAAFDAYFPQQDGGRWHRQTSDGLEVLTLVPAALRGVGVLHRLQRQGLYAADSSGRVPVAAILEHDCDMNTKAAGRLTRWHDAGVATLLETLD